MVLWFYVQENRKAEPTMILVLKRLRRRGHGLKSPLTDLELSLESYLRPLVYKA